MKLSEIFESPGKLEAEFEKTVDGREPLQRAVDEATDHSNKSSWYEAQMEKLEKFGEKVIEKTNLEEMFPDYELFRISRNGRKEFREYLLDYGKFGVLFDFRHDRATTHT